ncbi:MULTISPECIES: hypothetical protein [unclassified Stenotrophomonas maltophilia group]|uniref:hypothetical protein n=1 Tax=unclassified Stenotrophomonas maltophilia group TaxID=2961925 RepID=UPI00131F0CB2|nr:MULTISPECIES: hypothetical protein [unclassified Stenotrophomonas maltophilia group]
MLAAMAEGSRINAIKVTAGKKGGFKSVMTLSERRTLVEFFGLDCEVALDRCDSLKLGLGRELDRVRSWNGLRPEAA